MHALWQGTRRSAIPAQAPTRHHMATMAAAHQPTAMALSLAVRRHRMTPVLHRMDAEAHQAMPLWLPSLKQIVPSNEADLRDVHSSLMHVELAKG